MFSSNIQAFSIYCPGLRNQQHIISNRLTHNVRQNFLGQGNIQNCRSTRIVSVFSPSANLSNKKSRTLYPEIQIWRQISNNINNIILNFTRLASQEIKLNPGDFSPDGVLQYNLTTPISFQSGDVLGVYQPEESNSVVTVYYHDSDDVMMSKMYCSPWSFASNPPSSLTASIDQPLTVMNGKQLLILPITGKKSCRS